jgi:hypothetical protein
VKASPTAIARQSGDGSMIGVIFTARNLPFAMDSKIAKSGAFDKAILKGAARPLRYLTRV